MNVKALAAIVGTLSLGALATGCASNKAAEGSTTESTEKGAEAKCTGGTEAKGAEAKCTGGTEAKGAEAKCTAGGCSGAKKE